VQAIDDLGKAFNDALSDLRASAVVDYLARDSTSIATAIEAIGMGKDRLLVPTPDQTPEPLNRRVLVVNVGNQEQL
jgi:outer membrane protein OmpA-like peptidoglycan-associated protein